MGKYRDEPVANFLHFARHWCAVDSYSRAMAPVDASGARELIEAAVAAFSVLGGGMAYTSGFYAAQALTQRQPPEIVAQRVNEGIGKGFAWGSLPAIPALIIVMWS